MRTYSEILRLIDLEARERGGPSGSTIALFHDLVEELARRFSRHAFSILPPEENRLDGFSKADKHQLLVGRIYDLILQTSPPESQGRIRETAALAVSLLRAKSKSERRSCVLEMLTLTSLTTPCSPSAVLRLLDQQPLEVLADNERVLNLLARMVVAIHQHEMSSQFPGRRRLGEQLRRCLTKLEARGCVRRTPCRRSKGLGARNDTLVEVLIRPEKVQHSAVSRADRSTGSTKQGARFRQVWAIVEEILKETAGHESLPSQENVLRLHRTLHQGLTREPSWFSDEQMQHHLGEILPGRGSVLSSELLQTLTDKLKVPVESAWHPRITAEIQSPPDSPTSRTVDLASLAAKWLRLLGDRDRNLVRELASKEEEQSSRQDEAWTALGMSRATYYRRMLAIRASLYELAPDLEDDTALQEEFLTEVRSRLEK